MKWRYFHGNNSYLSQNRNLFTTPRYPKYLNKHINSTLTLISCFRNIIFSFLCFDIILYMIDILLQLILNLQPYPGKSTSLIMVILFTSKVLFTTNITMLHNSRTSYIIASHLVYSLDIVCCKKNKWNLNSDPCTTGHITLSFHHSSSTPTFVLASLYMSSLN